MRQTLRHRGSSLQHRAPACSCLQQPGLGWVFTKPNRTSRVAESPGAQQHLEERKTQGSPLRQVRLQTARVLWPARLFLCVCLLLFLLFCVFACVVFLIVFCTCFQHAWDDGRRRPGGARRASLGGALRELDKRFLGTPRPAASFAAEGCAEQSLLMLCW